MKKYMEETNSQDNYFRNSKRKSNYLIKFLINNLFEKYLIYHQQSMQRV